VLKWLEGRHLEARSLLQGNDTRVRRYAASRKVADSSPDEVIDFLNLPNPFSRTRPWALVSL
jgi:hypothetical protein